MEEIRNIEQHLVCHADAKRGLLEHTEHGNMIRVILPPGGEILFINRDTFTLIRRIKNGSFYVVKDYCNGSLMIG